MSSMRHLAARFVGSLWPGGPSAAAEAWVGEQLIPGERSLWRQMSGPDRRHAVGVARRVSATLDERATRTVIAAALLHDVGKIESGLGTLGRVVATVGRRFARIPLSRSMRRYLRHPSIGGSLLGRAGSDPLTVAWAIEHHLPHERWTLPPDLAAALKAADGD